MERKQEEMQFLGVFGIFQEAYKIIFSCRKIFRQITLALILPLQFIIINNEVELLGTEAGTKRYNQLSDHISSEFAYLCLFKVAYSILCVLFSLLSTAAVVYTIASIYAGREVSFKKVMSAVPKVWKRLMVTFLSIFVALLAYVAVAILVSSTVSVLEEVCGFKAMTKSRALIKGKMWTALIIFFNLTITSAVVNMAFQNLAVHGVSMNMAGRVFLGVICSALFLGLFLFGFVTQTVIYFVCKSNHHENIEKSALSDHLEAYHGEYAPLKSKDLQLEQYDV
ncbi:polyadenylate-binding protein B-binding protein [Salix suchowensis]|nr:polyadenylate-binding protein B-binding protein [Salix suchowensis]